MKFKRYCIIIMGKYIKLKNLFYLIHDSITVRYNIICQSKSNRFLLQSDEINYIRSNYIKFEMFLRLKFTIIEIDNVITILNKIRKMNVIDNDFDVNRNYNYYKLLSNIENLTKLNIIVKLINSHSERDGYKIKFIVEYIYDPKCLCDKEYYYLCFDFEIFELYICINREDHLNIETFQNLNIVRYLFKKLFTINLTDQLEKYSLYLL